ncbi:MAG: hypothetical protein QME40_04275 [bacterium]|nr:hypothetical protein [bacterium]
MKICHHCKKELNITDRIGRGDTCPYCQSDLHCCLNCRFYDEYASNKCRESQSEFVSDRERSNFCDYFVFIEQDMETKREDEAEKARTRFEQLFKGRKIG